MSKNITELSSESFDKETAKGLWVVDFWASWCGPCKMIAPIVDELADEMKGKVHFGKVNVDSEGELAGRYEVMSIPTLIFFKDGEIVDRVVGVQEKEELQGAIEQFL